MWCSTTQPRWWQYEAKQREQGFRLEVLIEQQRDLRQQMEDNCDSINVVRRETAAIKAALQESFGRVERSDERVACTPKSPGFRLGDAQDLPQDQRPVLGVAPCVNARPTTPAGPTLPATISAGIRPSRLQRQASDRITLPSAVSTLSLSSTIIEDPPESTPTSPSSVTSKSDTKTVTSAKIQEIVESNWHRRYSLTQTTWDACLLVWLQRTLSWYASLFVVFCGFLSFLAQSLFALAVLINMTESDFNKDFVENLRIWRLTVGHDFQYADQRTGIPLVKSVCQGSKVMVNGFQQAALFEHMSEFLPGWAKIVLQDGQVTTHATVSSVLGGPVLCMAALVLWLMKIFQEVQEVFHFSQAIWALPCSREKSLLKSTGSQLLLAAMSRRRAWALTVFVILPRLLVAGLLGYAGVLFITATTTMEELVLNTMALEFVLNIDDIIFLAIMPRTVCRILEQVQSLNCEPGEKKKMPIWHQCKYSVSVVFSVALPAVSIVCYLHLLEPTVSYMKSAMATMCGGDLDFVYLQRPDGIVLSASTGYVKESLFKQQAVFQRAHLMGVPGIDAEEEVSGDLFLEVGSVNRLAVVDELYPSLADLAEQRACSDLDKTSTLHELPLVLARLQEVTGLPDLSSCSHGTAFCSKPSLAGDLVRMYCPVACGCDNPLAGLLLLEGCPKHCRSKFNLRLSNLTCQEQGVEELTSSLTWTKYIAQVLSLRTVLKLQGTELEINTFLTSRGCTALPHLAYDFCVPGAQHLEQQADLGSMRPLCPLTCGCQHTGGEECPTSCTIQPFDKIPGNS